MQKIEIRDATADDAELIFNFVTELAIFEKAKDAVTATAEDIASNLFADHSTNHALICSCNDVPIGFALYFFNFSTWLGRNGIYLEDLYIKPEFRRQGLGRQLLQHLARLAVQHDCGRVEWSVLDWNESAISFYQSIGAKPLHEWIPYRLQGEPLLDLAKNDIAV